MAGIARTLRVTIDGVEHTIRTNPGDYAAWLEHTDQDGVDPEDVTWSYGDLLWLAHHAAVRMELTDLELDEFLRKGLDDLEVPGAGTANRAARRARG